MLVAKWGTFATMLVRVLIQNSLFCYYSKENSFEGNDV